jgi:hypothetical protein
MQGQALTEFIVLALALVPLFLLIPVIAKYQDIAHAIQIASRYVAFEATTRNGTASTWKSSRQLAQEVQRRFFSNPDSPIKTNDAAGNFKAHQNLFWRDQEGRPLIKNFEQDVQVSFGSNAAADHNAGFTNASDGAPFKGATGMSDALGLNARGIYRANVTAVLANFSDQAGGHTKTFEQFKDLNLTISRQTSVLIDPWGAKNPQEVEDRIDKLELFPGRILKPVAPLLDAAVVIVESPSCFKRGCIRGPKIGELEFWRDVVPADRLRK